ncbi:MAG: sugar phosphate isomerase/epimerase [Agriterribacter sp.]
MKFGINTFLFTSPFTTKSVSLFPQFKKWGFDAVEIALEDASHIDAKIVKKALDDNGLVCGSICAAMGGDRDFRGSASDQEGAKKYLEGIIDVMPDLGCSFLIGPLYSAVGRADFETPENYKKQWDLVVKHLNSLANYAQKANVTLCLEPLNRFETDFINTCDQVLKLANDIDHASVGVHLDTFHMNIEEKNQAKAILKAGSKLKHFHACGTDRGTPGNDSLNWTEIFNALKQIGYDNNIVIESFTPDVKIIAKAASIWRNMEPSQQSIAEEGVKFLKKAYAST